MPQSGKRKRKTKSLNRSAEKRPTKRVRKKSGGGFSPLGFFLVLCCILLAAALVASFAGLFRVTKIEIYGEAPYSREEILSAASVGVGQNIITLSENDVGSRITSRLPYVEKADISRNIDGTLSITVKAAKASFCAAATDGYYIISSSDKVLQKASDPPEGVMIIKGLCQKEETVGQKLSFDDAELKKIYETVKSNLKAYNLSCDYIDMTDKMNIVFRINDKYVVQLGSISNADGKFKHLGGILQKIDENATGIINLQLWTKNKPEGYFRQGSVENYFENN